ncbi:MAG TPA: hypothetical protein VF030_06120 [Solirubrobacterales bacterium]
MVIDLPGLALLSVEAHRGQVAGLQFCAISSQGGIAIGGEWGTLAEIAFARVIGHEVVALRSWELNGRERMAGVPA